MFLSKEMRAHTHTTCLNTFMLLINNNKLLLYLQYFQVLFFTVEILFKCHDVPMQESTGTFPPTSSTVYDQFIAVTFECFWQPFYSLP